MFDLDMNHIGKIEAVGTVQVFGYSSKRVDENTEDCIYLNYVGPSTAASSVWANLIERRALDFTDLKGKPHRLRHGGFPGLEGKEAGFKRFVSRIEHLALDHYILLDKRFYEPDYDAQTSLTFVFEGPEMAGKIGHHISQCVDITVFHEWNEGLLALGRKTRLIRCLRNYGGHPVWEIVLDRARWTQVISLAVERKELTWPGEEATETTRRLLATTLKPFLTIELPERLTALGWSLHWQSGTVQARGPEGSTRIYRLPGSVVSEAEIDEIRDELIHDIEQLRTRQAPPPISASNPPHTSDPAKASYTMLYDPPSTYVIFSSKPSKDIRDRLKSKDFHWNKPRQAWRSFGNWTQAGIARIIGYPAEQVPTMPGREADTAAAPESQQDPALPALPARNEDNAPLFTADDMIHAYTRAQAIEDGVLVDACIGDLAEVTKQHYACHVAMTSSVWGIIDRAVKNKKQFNDYRGVWHDVLSMSKMNAARVSSDVAYFKVKITGAGRQSLYTFKLVEGCGDAGEPVITIMLPEED